MTTTHQRVVWHTGNIKSLLESYTGSYDSAYISLGGKYNEPTVEFRNPAYLVGHDFPSNTQYQMFPMFVRFPKKRVKYSGDKVEGIRGNSRECRNASAFGTSSEFDTRCLVIIVDNFDNEETREINQKLIERATSQFAHLDVVLYDTTLHIRDIRPFTQSVVDWAFARGITPEKCIFANYIRFRGCSSIETAQFEVDIPRTIQNVLNESKVYAGCLYQWFGFQYYTYNLLYSYGKYDMSRHLKVIMLFHECAEATQVVSGNASHLFMFDLAREKHNKSVLTEFLKHTLDITSYAKHGGVLSSKMIDFCNYKMLGLDYTTIRPEYIVIE
jgi:hypothetical protein